MDIKKDNPYEILGVDQDADESTIKKAYFKLARQYHPDKQETEEDKQEMGSKFAKISDAYDLLTDPVRKQAWEQKNEERELRESRQTRSRSPKKYHQAQRRGSHQRSPPSSPGSLRPKQHPMFHSMPQRKTSYNRSPPRNINIRNTTTNTKRSVSPVPRRNGSQQQRRKSCSKSPQRPPSAQKPLRKQSVSPMRQRSTGNRRPTSPMPPRHPSPGTYRQSPGRLSPGTHQRRKYYQHPTSRTTTTTTSNIPKPQPARRASSGPSSPPTMTESSSLFHSMREEDLEKPRSCPRADWACSSTTSFNPDNLQKKKQEDVQEVMNPFEALGLHYTADKVEILTAYRALSFEHRPTKRYATESERLEAARQMQMVASAYETLRDPEQLQEWQQRSISSSSSSKLHNSTTTASTNNNQNNNESISENKFHDSISSKGSLFRSKKNKKKKKRDKQASPAKNSNEDGEDDDDDDDSFIGGDQQQIKTSIRRRSRSSKSSRGRKVSSHRHTATTSTTSSTGRPETSRSMSPKRSSGGGNYSKKKVSLLASLGFPTPGASNKRKESPKPPVKRRSLFNNLSFPGNNNKNASPVTNTKEEVPAKIDIVVATNDAPKEDDHQPVVKKLKKKKKKKKGLVDGEEKYLDDGTKIMKKKRKKKKKTSSSRTMTMSPNPSVDLIWKREESKRVILVVEGSDRTARESVTSLGDDHEVVVSALATTIN